MIITNLLVEARDAHSDSRRGWHVIDANNGCGWFVDGGPDTLGWKTLVDFAERNGLKIGEFHSGGTYRVTTDEYDELKRLYPDSIDGGTFT